LTKRKAHIGNILTSDHQSIFSMSVTYWCIMRMG